GVGSPLATGTFTPVPGAPPNTYQATIPAHVGSGLATFAVACGIPPNPWTLRYYDPSGTVRDGAGNAVAGATVTLLRSDTAGGPFVALLNGSDTMSPENRRNPDLTLGDGTYAWDVAEGFYRVHAEKDGCTADSAVVQ